MNAMHAAKKKTKKKCLFKTDSMVLTLNSTHVQGNKACPTAS